MLCVLLLCLQRVSEVYEQQCADVQDPQLPVDAATQLVGHMLNLQAEGLSVAQVGANGGHFRHTACFSLLQQTLGELVCLLASWCVHVDCF
jgi:hypothetical protein